MEGGAAWGGGCLSLRLSDVCESALFPPDCDAGAGPRVVSGEKGGMRKKKLKKNESEKKKEKKKG